MLTSFAYNPVHFPGDGNGSSPEYVHAYKEHEVITRKIAAEHGIWFSDFIQKNILK